MKNGFMTKKKKETLAWTWIRRASSDSEEQAISHQSNAFGSNCSTEIEYLQTKQSDGKILVKELCAWHEQNILTKIGPHIIVN